MNFSDIDHDIAVWNSGYIPPSWTHEHISLVVEKKVTREQDKKVIQEQEAEDYENAILEGERIQNICFSENIQTIIKPSPSKLASRKIIMSNVLFKNKPINSLQSGKCRMINSFLEDQWFIVSDDDNKYTCWYELPYDNERYLIEYSQKKTNIVAGVVSNTIPTNVSIIKIIDLHENKEIFRIS